MTSDATFSVSNALKELRTRNCDDVSDNLSADDLTTIFKLSWRPGLEATELAAEIDPTLVRRSIQPDRGARLLAAIDSGLEVRRLARKVLPVRLSRLRIGENQSVEALVRAISPAVGVEATAEMISAIERGLMEPATKDVAQILGAWAALARLEQVQAAESYRRLVNSVATTPRVAGSNAVVSSGAQEVENALVTYFNQAYSAQRENTPLSEG